MYIFDYVDKYRLDISPICGPYRSQLLSFPSLAQSVTPAEGLSLKLSEKNKRM